jgi:hypothetical protein
MSGDLSPEQVRAAALHEAAHAVVAHAVGRRVTYVRATAKPIPVDHPSHVTAAGGITNSEPDLADEVNLRYELHRPFTDAQREWLAQDAVAVLAGGMAEHAAGVPPMEVMLVMIGDATQSVQASRMLRRGGTGTEREFRRAASAATRTILDDLGAEVERLRDLLLDRGELGEAEVAEALAGVPCGSHRHLLATVEAVARGRVVKDDDDNEHDLGGEA